MTKVIKGYKFRIYPNKDQRDLLARSFGSNRFVWNSLLAKQKELHEAWVEDRSLDRPSPNFKGFNDQLNALKSNHDWLHDVSSVSLQQTTRHLAGAFSTFFRELRKGKVSYPNFKKRSNRNSITLVQSGFRIRDGKLYIAKSKDPIKVKWSRDLPTTPSSCVVSQEPAGDYYVSFVVETEPALTNGTKETGVDLGLTHLAITSDGGKLDNPKYLIKSQNQLKRQQRRLSKKQRGSKNRTKARLRLARIHRKIANQRKDNLHKISRKLVNENQVLALETLKVSNLVKNNRLAKSISDVSWNTLVKYIVYKARESHRCVTVLMHPLYPSTQLCSNCNTKPEEKITLKVRKWTCNTCHTKHDRDVNAAMNILAKAKDTLKKVNPSGTWTNKLLIADLERL